MMQWQYWLALDETSGTRRDEAASNADSSIHLEVCVHLLDAYLEAKGRLFWTLIPNDENSM